MDAWDVCVQRPAWSPWHVSGSVQGLHDITNVEGPSWKANGQSQVIGPFVPLMVTWRRSVINNVL